MSLLRCISSVGSVEIVEFPSTSVFTWRLVLIERVDISFLWYTCPAVPRRTGLPRPHGPIIMVKSSINRCRQKIDSLLGFRLYRFAWHKDCCRHTCGPQGGQAANSFDETGELRSLRLRLASEVDPGRVTVTPVPVTMAQARGSRPWIYNSHRPPPAPWPVSYHY